MNKNNKYYIYYNIYNIYDELFDLYIYGNIFIYDNNIFYILEGDNNEEDNIINYLNIKNIFDKYNVFINIDSFINNELIYFIVNILL